MGIEQWRCPEVNRHEAEKERFTSCLIMITEEFMAVHAFRIPECSANTVAYPEVWLIQRCGFRKGRVIQLKNDSGSQVRIFEYRLDNWRAVK